MTDNDVLRAGLAELAEDVTIIDLRERVRAGVRRQTALRNAAIGGTAAVATAAAVVVGTLPRSVGAPAPNTGTPSVGTSAPSVATSTPSLGTSAPNRGGIRAVDFRNATFEIPPWPTDDPLWRDFTSFCGSGPRQFVGGESAQTSPEPNYSPPAPPGGGAPYRIPSRNQPIYAELDGQPGEDALVPISCVTTGAFGALLGLTIGPADGLNTLGWVFPPYSGNGGYDEFDVAVEDRDVVVQLRRSDEGMTSNPRFEQVRRYRFVDGAFRQVGGPTEFPGPIGSISDVDFRNYSVGFYGPGVHEGACNGDAIVLTNGVAEDTPNIFGSGGGPRPGDRMRYELRQVSLGKVESFGDQSAILTFTCTRLTDNAVFEAVFATALWDGQLALLTPIVATDLDGIRGVVNTRVENGSVVVTVRTAAGEQVWRYGSDAMGQFTRR